MLISDSNYGLLAASSYFNFRSFCKNNVYPFCRLINFALISLPS